MTETKLFESTLAKYQKAIGKEAENFFATLNNQLGYKDLSKYSVEALELLRDYTERPSKRIRGTLAAWAYDQQTGKNLDPVGLKLAVAFELIQNYLLIVDDVMDRSDSRRGKPSVHKLYAKDILVKNDEHLANMLAINVGLLAMHLSSWLVAKLNVPADRVAKASELMHRNIAGTVFGQVDDLYQHVNHPSQRASIIRTYYLKNSVYTIINPLQLGLAIAGKLTPKAMVEPEKYGAAAGIAYQLRDDLIGVFGDPKVTGKSNLDDIKEGKMTLLMHYALENASNAQAKELRSYLGNPKLTQNQLLKAQKILDSCGAEAFVNKRIKFYAKQAKAVIENGNLWNKPAKAFLYQLVDFISERQK